MELNTVSPVGLCGPGMWLGTPNTGGESARCKSIFKGHSVASLEAQMVKNPPAVWETWVRSLGWEDPLEKGMATHSSILAWRNPWTDRLVGQRRTQPSY